MTTNIALLVAHESVDGKRGAFIDTKGGQLYENEFSEIVTGKLANSLVEKGVFTPFCFGFENINSMVKRINKEHKKDRYDLAITIHFDSYSTDWTNRTRVFHGVAGGLAETIARNMEYNKFNAGFSKAVKHGSSGYDSFQFIRDTKMPALLIEAFNSKDPAIERLFADGLYSERAQAWMDAFVEGIARGVKEYYAK